MITGNITFLNSFMTALLQTGQLNTTGSNYINVYSGAIPTDVQAANFNTSTFASQLVAQFTATAFQVVGPLMRLTSLPASVTIPAAKTVTWGALVGRSGIAVIASTDVYGGTGAIVLNTLSPSAGGTLTVLDAGIRLAFER